MAGELWPHVVIAAGFRSVRRPADGEKTLAEECAVFLQPVTEFIRDLRNIKWRAVVEPHEKCAVVREIPHCLTDTHPAVYRLQLRYREAVHEFDFDVMIRHN